MDKTPSQTMKLEPRTTAASREKERFDAAYQRQLEQAQQQVAFTIMVWGPGKKSKSPVARKRWETYKELLNLGHNAVASEDLTDTKFTGNFSEATKEFAQAKEAHLMIVFIEEAPGALGETHDFASDPDLAQKFFVFVPQKYRGGYSAKGVIRDLDKGWHGVYWYKDDEVPACAILTKAVEWVETRRQVEYRRKRKHS